MKYVCAVIVIVAGILAVMLGRCRVEEMQRRANDAIAKREVVEVWAMRHDDIVATRFKEDQVGAAIAFCLMSGRKVSVEKKTVILVLERP